ncbi:hypothetical protein EYF80_007225 [Liparis tanakae]|uniref:Uncharacterized protein n=1 Tax=Liparis tanakae TaxID=230148 RepID=A0A4Z2IWP8_9TELE|nr:hypothetical protein EYF80_007225 [Liparis tanakae]
MHREGKEREREEAVWIEGAMERERERERLVPGWEELRWGNQLTSRPGSVSCIPGCLKRAGTLSDGHGTAEEEAPLTGIKIKP